MNKIIICILFLFYGISMCSARQDYRNEAYRNIPQYFLQDDQLKKIVKDFILNEQRHCKDYSINWYFIIDVKKIDNHLDLISLHPIEMALKSLYLDTDNDLAYINYMGHFIFVEGDFKGHNLFYTDNKYRLFSYRKYADNDYSLLGSWTEGYTEVMYEYDKKMGTFRLVQIERDNDLYSE